MSPAPHDPDRSAGSDDAIDDVYVLLGERVPSVGGLIDVPDRPPEPVGALMDHEWLTARVEDGVQRYSCPDRRVVSTLWWYSASAAILAPFAAALLADGRAVDPAAAQLRVWLEPDGYFRSTRSPRLLARGPEAAGRSLGPAFRGTIQLLAEIGGASPRSLWSIAGDALSTQLLRAGEELDCISRASDLALEVSAAAPDLPTPRFEDLDTIIGRWRFVRRGSCCLLYEASGFEKCNSCPRRPRLDRHTAMCGGGP